MLIEQLHLCHYTNSCLCSCLSAASQKRPISATQACQHSQLKLHRQKICRNVMLSLSSVTVFIHVLVNICILFNVFSYSRVQCMAPFLLC